MRASHPATSGGADDVSALASVRFCTLLRISRRRQFIGALLGKSLGKLLLLLSKLLEILLGENFHRNILVGVPRTAAKGHYRGEQCHAYDHNTRIHVCFPLQTTRK